MFELYSTAAETRGGTTETSTAQHQYNAQFINQLYERHLRRGQLMSLWAWVTRRSRALLPLADIEEQGRVRARHSVPLIQEVALTQIRGTEGRPGGFDSSFYPIQWHTANRWKSVATAWLDGVRLPPVLLIEVGEVYYVRDGHHRVSVFKAFGVDYIEAVVTRWEVEAVALCAVHATVECLECVPGGAIG